MFLHSQLGPKFWNFRHQAVLSKLYFIFGSKFRSVEPQMKDTEQQPKQVDFCRRTRLPRRPVADDGHDIFGWLFWIRTNKKWRLVERRYWTAWDKIKKNTTNFCPTRKCSSIQTTYGDVWVAKMIALKLGLLTPDLNRCNYFIYLNQK